MFCMTIDHRNSVLRSYFGFDVYLHEKNEITGQLFLRYCKDIDNFLL